MNNFIIQVKIDTEVGFQVKADEVCRFRDCLFYSLCVSLLLSSHHQLCQTDDKRNLLQSIRQRKHQICFSYVVFDHQS